MQSYKIILQIFIYTIQCYITKQTVFVIYWQNVEDLWEYTTALQAHKVMLFEVCLKVLSDDLKRVFHMMALTLTRSVICSVKLFIMVPKYLGLLYMLGNSVLNHNEWVRVSVCVCVHACIILFYSERMIILCYNMFWNQCYVFPELILKILSPVSD